MSDRNRAHSVLLAEVSLELSARGVLVLANNSGCLRAENGRPIRYGLGSRTGDREAFGSSDLICCARGRFVALEVKTGKARLTPAQLRFFELVKAHGGMAAEVRCVEDALAAVGLGDGGDA